MDKKIIYNTLCSEILCCSKCDLGCELLDGYKPNVVGQGNLNSRIFVVAQNPGINETIKCEPLTITGASGKKFSKTLEELGIERNTIYVSNGVKCRSPKNREPEPWEQLKCLDFLKREIEIVRPEIIIAFGRFAANIFLKDFKMTKDHGVLKHSDEFNIDVFSFHHPAYIQCYADRKTRELYKQDVQTLKTTLIEKQIILPTEAK